MLQTPSTIRARQERIAKLKYAPRNALRLNITRFGQCNVVGIYKRFTLKVSEPVAIQSDIMARRADHIKASANRIALCQSFLQTVMKDPRQCHTRYCATGPPEPSLITQADRPKGVAFWELPRRRSLSALLSAGILVIATIFESERKWADYWTSDAIAALRFFSIVADVVAQ